MRVTVTIEGPRARTVVDHVFRNPHDKQLEGTIEYPLPASASPCYYALEPGHRCLLPGHRPGSVRARRTHCGLVSWSNALARPALLRLRTQS